MIIVKMLLAVWTSVYLVLPSCPCQILAALGMGNTNNQNTYVERYDAKNDSKLPQFNSILNDWETDIVCHCQDDAGKLAEQSDFDDEIKLGCTCNLVWVESDWFPIHQFANTFSGNSPPAALELTSHLPRQVIGVYLL